MNDVKSVNTGKKSLSRRGDSGLPKNRNKVRPGNKEVKRYVDGKPVSLPDFPLVAFTLSCGHSDRQLAIQKSDNIFCTICQELCRVSKILAQ